MDLEIVERIVALAGEYAVSEITVEQGGQRISVRKPLSALAPAPLLSTPEAAAETMSATPELAASEETVPAEKTLILTAPMVGIFHHAEPFLRFGTTIAAGQVVGQIESMKLMNEVTAEGAGQISEVLIEDGAPVEYGQALFRLSSQ